LKKAGRLGYAEPFRPASGLEAVVHGAVYERWEVDAAVASIVDAAARFNSADLLVGNQFRGR
jgi:hypothetical protein